MKVSYFFAAVSGFFFWLAGGNGWLCIAIVCALLSIISAVEWFGYLYYGTLIQASTDDKWGAQYPTEEEIDELDENK